MPLTSRVLSPHDVTDLGRYLEAGGGRALRAARQLAPDAVIFRVEESGLRARGGSGIPCGSKWRAIRSFSEGAAAPPTVVVNAVDGEPGSFKDREIFRRNPYRVLEGALIATHAVGAGELIIATKLVHDELRERARRAVGEIRAAGWLEGLAVEIFDGPDEYLLGEETALLEAIDGRMPFPRIAPPYRRGIHEILDRHVGEASLSASAAHVELAGPGPEAVGSPALVNNVETLANVPGIIEHGSAWFRSVGTAESPGTIVCTIVGATERDGVGEVPMGTPLREVIELIGGGIHPAREIKAVLGSVATPILTGAQLDVPVSHEGMQAVGSQLGCGGFFVFDDHTDMAAVAAGVARFLAIESCGLCIPCKEDGLALADLFDAVRRSSATDRELTAIDDRLDTVDYGARCHLATQYKLVLKSILDRFGEEVEAHVHHGAPALRRELITTIVDIRGGRAVLDTSHDSKQPDWTFDARWSGKSPADRQPDLPHHLTHI